MAKRGVLNVHDPETWMAMPQATRSSAMEAVHSQIVKACIRTNLETLELLKDEGVNLRRVVLLMVHYTETWIPEDERKRMTPEQQYWTLIQGMDGVPIPDYFPDYVQEKFLKAMKTIMPPTEELFGMIVVGGKAVIHYMSISDYKRHLEVEEALRRETEENDRKEAEEKARRKAEAEAKVAAEQAPAGDPQ